jgi:SpoVK/Ycf46/Vps4 family AAA+-type ATPase
MPDALVRNGRLEKHIYIGAPDFSDRTDILHMFLNKNPIFSKVKAKEIANNSLKSIDEDQLKFYDIGYFLTSEDEKSFYITGTKNAKLEKISWIKS